MNIQVETLCRACTDSDEVITLDHAYHGHVISLMGISPYKFNKAGTGPPPTTHVAPVPDVYRGVHRNDDSANAGADMGEVYAEDVAAICRDLQSRGLKPGCFIAESLQSCGGNILYHGSGFNTTFCTYHMSTLFCDTLHI